MTEQEFTDWFCKNYPKDTDIHDPMWHASRIYRRAQLAAPTAPEVWCGCGDKIMPDDGARCGTCVAVKTAFTQGDRN